MSNEIELKLLIKYDDVAKLHSHPAIQKRMINEPLTRQLVSTYYDTPDLDLLHKRINLRVRHMSGGWFQAVKGTGQSIAGLHQRMEWEDVISGDRPDFDKIREPSLRRIFADKRLRESLSPIFVTDVQRTEWHLSYADGTEIEVALDFGQLEVKEKTETISEIELELKQGHTWRLYELAVELQLDIPLWIENVSKAERGYRHYTPTSLSVSHARTISPLASSTPQSTLQALGLECLRQIQANQEPALLKDKEATRQMHQAAILLIMGFDLFHCNEAKLLTDIRWFERLTGQTLHWHEAKEAMLAQLSLTTDINRIEEELHQQQCEQYRRLKNAINSQRYHGFLLRLGFFFTKLSNENAA